MRSFFALLTALCLLLFGLPATAESPPTPTPLPGYTLHSTEEEVRVFANPNMKANIVGYLLPGSEQEVNVLSVTENWCYIRFTATYGTGYGYVPLAYFDVAPAATATPAPDEAVTYQGGTQAWVMNPQEGYRLNLREEPAATAKSLGKYYTGAPAVLTGNIKNGFAQVLMAGTTFGWLDMRYLTTDALSFVPETPMVTISNAGSGAVLRSGPGASYGRLGWYAHGTAVTVLGVGADGWYHVQVDEQFGFISESLLSGTFPYGYGMDSDNPPLTDNMADGSQHLYINTRSAGGQLNLRKSASSTSKSLGVFYTGTPVTVQSYTRSGWAYVRIGQTEGYMDADYLTPTKPTQYGTQRTVRNRHATGLNLRSLPSTGGELLSFAPNYSAVTVLGELSDGWCYVEYNGTIGYMMGTYLK